MQPRDAAVSMCMSISQKKPQTRRETDEAFCMEERRTHKEETDIAMNMVVIVIRSPDDTQSPHDGKVVVEVVVDVNIANGQM